MKKISKYFLEHLSKKIIFILDMITSLASAIFVLLIVKFTFQPEEIDKVFALWWIGGTIVCSALTMYIFKSYNVIIRHMSLGDVKKYVIGIFLSNLLLGVLLYVFCRAIHLVFLALTVNFLLTVILVLGVRFVMIEFYNYYKKKFIDFSHSQRILVYGTSDKSVAAISRFSNSKHYKLIGFISDDPGDENLKISGYPVICFSDENDFKSIVKNLSLYAILFVREDDVRKEEQSLLKYCNENKVRTLITPSVDEIVEGKVMKSSIRKVKIEDLLGRPEINISIDEIKRNFHDKVVMVTGAAGSIGSELCRQLAGIGVKQLVLFDNAETPMHNLRLDLEEHFPGLNFVPVIGSVRHENRLDYAFRNWKPQVVFHAAAYKHVPLMEENPCEAVFANVHGSRLVADKCVEYGVEKMVMISTDKAVNPTNVMGCSKRLAEIYIQSLGIAMSKGEIKGNTKFVTTRFGNVLGSNGSVIPRFREQIENGGPVTVTHPDITRFFMTIPEACRLVMEAATMSDGNQIFVFDMGEPVKIVDLAKRMIELAGLKVGEDIEIKFSGLRPGEKLYEEVLANAENTEPTSHDRIRIAKVREYDYQEALNYVTELTRLSKAVNIPELVQLMKKVVPEYKSNNSKFEIYDKNVEEKK